MKVRHLGLIAFTAVVARTIENRLPGL